MEHESLMAAEENEVSEDMCPVGRGGPKLGASYGNPSLKRRQLGWDQKGDEDSVREGLGAAFRHRDHT